MKTILIRNALRVARMDDARQELSGGDILIEGEVLYLATEEEGKVILTGWKKDKKLPKDIRLPLLNHVLSKSNIEAILLSREMGLPAPIMLPRIGDEVQEKLPEKPDKAQLKLTEGKKKQ